MTYNFSATQNNGRIVSSADGVTGENVSYTYDALNRLIAAATTGTGGVQWGESYSYDGFGNLTSKVPTKGTAPQVYPQVNSATNQARMIGDYGFDANGNWLGAGGSQSNTWNVENQLISNGAVDGSGNLLTYTYDPWGKRVLQYSVHAAGSQGSGTLYFYGISGQRLGSYQLNDYPPAYGGIIALTPMYIPQYFGKRMLVAMDRLGSVRNSQNGSMAYYPWGEERTTTTDGTDKFGTYFRDSSVAGVGQDYANARYYNNNFGRFWSPDPGGVKAVDPKDPTSWNRYTYVNGDPVNHTDRSGLYRTAQDCIDNPDACGDEDWGSDGGAGAIDLAPCNNPIASSFMATGQDDSSCGDDDDSADTPLECDATLYYRQVNVSIAKPFHATHAYWEIQMLDPVTDQVLLDEIISAGPNKVENPGTGKSKTYLDVWVHSPSQGPDMPENGTSFWDSGLSDANCAGVTAMLNYATYWQRNYNDNTALYGGPFGPNSNSVAALFGQEGGFNPPAPPGSFGWNYWLQ
jgi:RHS repeat-associated protein